VVVRKTRKKEARTTGFGIGITTKRAGRQDWRRERVLSWLRRCAASRQLQTKEGGPDQGQQHNNANEVNAQGHHRPISLKFLGEKLLLPVSLTAASPLLPPASDYSSSNFLPTAAKLSLHHPIHRHAPNNVHNPSAHQRLLKSTLILACSQGRIDILQAPKHALPRSCCTRSSHALRSTYNAPRRPGLG
jgi:hypothetical protein